MNVTDPTRSSGLGTSTRLSAILRTFPVTFAVATPYLILILPFALWNGNPQTGFIVGVAAIALTACMIVEVPAAFRPRQSARTRNYLDKYGRGLYRLGLVAIISGTVIGVMAAYSGVGAIDTQVGLAQATGPIVAISSLTRGWGIVGTAFVFGAYLASQCSKKQMLVALAILLVGQGLEAFFTARTAPLLEYVTYLATSMLILGMIRIRHAIVAVVLVLVVWPLAFDFRNQLRTDVGVTVSSSVDAFDRLRFDEQVGRAVELDVPVTVEHVDLLQHPNFFEVLRFGLVPRALDADRPAISTGLVINMALGGTATSAYTFLPVTTTYVLEGPFFLFAWYLFLALFVTGVWRGGTRLSLPRLFALLLVLWAPLGWFSTFPDKTIGVLQIIISSVPLMLMLPLTRKPVRRRLRPAKPTLRI